MLTRRLTLPVQGSRVCILFSISFSSHNFEGDQEMKKLIIACFFIANPAFAIDASIVHFCRDDVNLRPDTFVVTYDTKSAHLSDVSKVINVVGGLGHTVGLKVETMGPKFNLAKTSLEAEMNRDFEFGQLVLRYQSAGASEAQEKQVLNIFEQLFNYPGFRIACKPNLSTPN